MKFLVDAQLPPGLARWFRVKGHEADHVFEIGLGAASDREIAERAEADNAILASKDEDFVILRLPDRFALLWMRCRNTTNKALAEWMEVAGFRWRRCWRLRALCGNAVKRERARPRLRGLPALLNERPFDMVGSRADMLFVH